MRLLLELTEIYVCFQLQKHVCPSRWSINNRIDSTLWNHDKEGQVYSSTFHQLPLLLLCAYGTSSRPHLLTKGTHCVARMSVKRDNLKTYWGHGLMYSLRCYYSCHLNWGLNTLILFNKIKKVVQKDTTNFGLWLLVINQNYLLRETLNQSSDVKTDINIYHYWLPNERVWFCWLLQKPFQY